MRPAAKHEYVATITQQGRVTIPPEVRRLLRVKAGDKIAFRVEGDSIRLVHVEFTLERAFGSVTPLRRPEDFSERSQIAKAEKVEKTLRDLRKP